MLSLHPTPCHFPRRHSSGNLDVLVNNCAIQPTATCVPLHELSEAHWEKLLSVNLTSVFFASKAVRPSPWLAAAEAPTQEYAAVGSRLCSSLFPEG